MIDEREHTSTQVAPNKGVVILIYEEPLTLLGFLGFLLFLGEQQYA